MHCFEKSASGMDGLSWVAGSCMYCIFLFLSAFIIFNKTNMSRFYNKNNEVKKNGGPGGPVHSLYPNLALTSLSRLHNELFTCLSPSRADGLTLRRLLPSLPRGHTVAPPGLWRGLQERVGSTDPTCPQFRLTEGRASGGVRRSCGLVTLPPGHLGPRVGSWVWAQGQLFLRPCQGALAGSTQPRK